MTTSTVLRDHELVDEVGPVEIAQGSELGLFVYEDAGVFTHSIKPNRRPSRSPGDNSLFQFVSSKPRMEFLDRLRKFFSTPSIYEPILYHSTAWKNLEVTSATEDFLDSVSMLPEELQAVALIVGVERGYDDFAYARVVAEKHWEQWGRRRLRPYRPVDVELFLYPHVSHWGADVWTAVKGIEEKKLVWDFSITNPVVKSLEDEDYRKLLVFLVTAPDAFFKAGYFDYWTKVPSSGRPTLGQLIEDEYTRINKTVRILSGREWISLIPFHNSEIRKEVLGLTAGEIAYHGHSYMSVPEEVFLFNLRAYKRYDPEDDRFLVRKIQESVTESFQEMLDKESDGEFSDVLSWSPRTNKWGLLSPFADYVVSLADGEEKLDAFREMPAIFGSRSTWHSSFSTFNSYIITRLAESTGSVQQAFRLVISASKSKLSLHPRDWFNLIENYEQVRGVDLSIAVELLRS